MLRNPEFIGVLTGRFDVDAESAQGLYLCITSDDIYVDAPYLSIRWDSVNHLVHAEWKAFANSAEFRAGLSKGKLNVEAADG